MTIFEALFFNRELISRLRSMGIRLEDIDYINLFVDYNAMINAGEKVSYAVTALSDRYRISERKIYTILQRFKSHCMLDAV